MSTNPADGTILGTLYGTDAMRAVFDEATYFQRMLDVEAALARAQAKLGIIPADAAPAIVAAAKWENLDPAELAASARNVGYPVVGLVRGLSRAAGEAGRWTHWGATTQDIMDTAIVLQVRDGLGLIEQSLIALLRALTTQARRHRDTVMAGRTHLQQALPTSFGLKCATWALPLIRHLERLAQLRPRVEQVSFGGAAGTLASLGDKGVAVMEALAAELSLRPSPPPGTLPATAWPRPSASSASSPAASPSSPPTPPCSRRPRSAKYRNPTWPGAAPPRPCRRSATRSPPNTCWRARAAPGDGAADARSDGAGPRTRHRAVAGRSPRDATVFRPYPWGARTCPHDRRRNGRGCRPHAPQPRSHRRSDRGGGGDDGSRPACSAAARRITWCSAPATWPYASPCRWPKR